MPQITGLSFVGLSVRDARASAAWYATVLGFTIVCQVPADGWHAGAAILRHPATGFELGVSAHRANRGEPFSEARTGLDHLEFGVRDRDDLEAWIEHLDRHGVPHSGIKERASAFILTCRDPDNVQLELNAPRVTAPKPS